ncbi:MAG: helix-turn-helix domain-containing protein [Dysgonamonadaceae bacterium]|nr:helix-turn-helix domain-containing protein [Dysgonamonadaceae bacterium]
MVRRFDKRDNRRLPYPFQSQTPIKYINAKKIEKVQLRLLTTGSSIRDIALDLSIDNISYFNQIFRQHTGVTPSEYKKNTIVEMCLFANKHVFINGSDD